MYFSYFSTLFRLLWFFLGSSCAQSHLFAIRFHYLLISSAYDWQIIYFIGFQWFHSILGMCKIDLFCPAIDVLAHPDNLIMVGLSLAIFGAHRILMGVSECTNLWQNQHKVWERWRSGTVPQKIWNCDGILMQPHRCKNNVIIWYLVQFMRFSWVGAFEGKRSSKRRSDIITVDLGVRSMEKERHGVKDLVTNTEGRLCRLRDKVPAAFSTTECIDY